MITNLRIINQVIQLISQVSGTVTNELLNRPSPAIRGSSASAELRQSSAAGGRPSQEEAPQFADAARESVET